MQNSFTFHILILILILIFAKKLTCYIKNIRDITMDNKLTTVPDDAATRETNPKKI